MMPAEPIAATAGHAAPDSAAPPSFPRENGWGRFALALMAAAMLEVAAGLWLISHPSLFEAATDAPEKPVVQVHMVELPPPPKPAEPPKEEPPPPPPPPEPPPPPPPEPPPPPPPPEPPPPPPPPQPAPVVEEPPPPPPKPSPVKPRHTPRKPPAPVQQVQTTTPPPPAAEPPPPAPRPAASPAQAASALQRYVAELRARVQAALVVPMEVRMMHLSGDTIVAIRLSPEGTLVSASVVATSGAAPIDRAALAAVRASQFAAFPDELGHAAKTFNLTVHLATQ